jgi:hypothetical protein
MATFTLRVDADALGGSVVSACVFIRAASPAPWEPDQSEGVWASLPHEMTLTTDVPSSEDPGDESAAIAYDVRAEFGDAAVAGTIAAQREGDTVNLADLIAIPA